MNDSIQELLNLLQSKSYHSNRTTRNIDITDKINQKSSLEISSIRLSAMLDAETPILLEHDSMGFYRSLTTLPTYSKSDTNDRCFDPCNITPNYARIMSSGLNRILLDSKKRQQTCNAIQKPFWNSVTLSLESVLAYASRYAQAIENFLSKQQGSPYEYKYIRLHQALLQIPHKEATSFYEACVFMKLLIFTLRCNANDHLTLGRFDQYMYPYYCSDIQKGIPEEELFELLEEFFLSINFDTDLYHGIQQGDNGQSMVLGGKNQDGTFAFNELSHLCIKASLELNLIDPKINLRVGNDTPFSIYLLGTQLTQKGLGFPQYCNDDVVIPGLMQLGYDKADAYNYTVAACWEYITPNCGADIPNITTMNFPKVVNTVIYLALSSCESFPQLLNQVRIGIERECDLLMEACNQIDFRPSPYLSVFVDGCLEKGMDISQNAAKYNNSGIHGTGIANAADALASIKKLIYEKQSLTKEVLLEALDCDFAGYEELRNELLACPKMGNNDDFVDSIASVLMDAFASYLNGKSNNRNGIYRAGTGSAMEYLWSARLVGATADGRRAYTPYGSSFSPSLDARLDGPLSLIQSFTKFDMKQIINGGPLTIEIHDTTFRNQDGIEKVARLVQTFIRLGGHQLQLNSINRDILLDAKQHPEKYSNLIVRVWGWSGYFNELDSEYQDHIIRRTEFCM